MRFGRVPGMVAIRASLARGGSVVAVAAKGERHARMAPGGAPRAPPLRLIAVFLQVAPDPPIPSVAQSIRH